MLRETESVISTCQPSNCPLKLLESEFTFGPPRWMTPPRLKPTPRRPQRVQLDRAIGLDLAPPVTFKPTPKPDSVDFDSDL